jgi:hypothetical protein
MRAGQLDEDLRAGHGLWLMRDVRATAFVVLSGALFTQLAGVLSDQPLWQTGWAMVGLCTWLVALASCGRFLRTPRARLIGISITSSASIGAIVLLYLHGEFA